MSNRVLALALCLVLSVLILSCEKDPTKPSDPKHVTSQTVEPFSRIMNGTVHARDVVETSDGNSVVVGTFWGQMDITDSDSLVAQNAIGDLFLLSFTPAGAVSWSKGFAYDGTTFATRIGRDASDNLYVGGIYGRFSTLVFNTSLPVYGKEDLFVSKLDKTGEPLWTIGGGAYDIDHLADMLVTPEGDLFVCGWLSYGAASLGGVEFGGGSSYSGFLAALGSDGSGRWAATAKASDVGYAVCRALARNEAGTVYVGGDFSQGTVEVAGHTFEKDRAQDKFDMFVAGFDPDGKPTTAFQIRGNGWAYLAALATLDGGPVVMGNISDTADFDMNNPGGEITSAGETDAFVARYDTNGELMWVKTIGATAAEETVRKVCRIGVSDLLVLGTFTNSITFGDKTYTTHGAHDFYVARLNADGEVLWGAPLGGPGDDIVGLITSDGEGWAATGWADLGDFEFPDGTIRPAGGSFLYRQP